MNKSSVILQVVDNDLCIGYGACTYACDFCDDVVTELADISLGDAWLEPYNLDGRGTSLIITRSPLAESIIKEGISNSRLTVNSLTSETMKASQQGSYNHRHEGLYVRIKEARIKG